jgi:HSP20 family protein
VVKENMAVKIEKDILKVDGEIDPTPYQNLVPLYTEYNVGHFTRRFELPNEIDQSKIKAGMNDGVLTLTLPKVPEKQPRLIEIN